MSLVQEPPFEIAAADLAAWVEQQGADRWWSMDGDPFLTGRIPFSSPGDELAEDLRRINRVLLVHDLKERPDSRGQQIGASDLDGLAGHLGDDIPFAGARPTWAEKRLVTSSARARWRPAHKDRIHRKSGAKQSAMAKSRRFWPCLTPDLAGAAL